MFCVLDPFLRVSSLALANGLPEPPPNRILSRYRWKSIGQTTGFGTTALLKYNDPNKQGVKTKKVNEFGTSRSYTLAYLGLKLVHLIIVLAQFR
jgi:hypothetical protein